MKIMLDTNIIISAALFPKGRAAQAFFKALLPPYQPIVFKPLKKQPNQRAKSVI